TIGVVMSCFAVATFVVRAVLTQLVRHVHQWLLIASAMTVAGTAYFLFPLVQSVPLLMALSFVLGLGLGASQPVIMALLYEPSPAPGSQDAAYEIGRIAADAAHHPYPVPRRAPAVEPDQRRPAAAARNDRPRLQGDQHAREQGRARRGAGRLGHEQRARRSSEEAGRPLERNPARSQCLGRQPGCLRLRGGG